MMKLFSLFPILVFVLCNPKPACAQNQKLDSLQSLLKTLSKENYFQVIEELGREYDKREFKLAKEAAERTIELIKKYRPELMEAQALAYDKLSYVYANWNLSAAIKYLLQSAKIYKESSLIRLYSIALVKVALFQHKAENIEIAKDYYLQILDLPADSLDHRTLINCYNGLGLIDRSKRYYEDAIIQFENAMEIAEESQDDAWIGILKGNIGSVYDLQGRYLEALPYYLENAVISKKTKEIENLVETYIKLGNLHLKLKKYPLAQQYFDSSLVAIRMQDELFPPYTLIYEGLSRLNEENGNFEEAYKYLLLHKQTKDSLDRRRKRNELLGIQSEFEFKQQEADIRYLKKEREDNEIIKNYFYWSFVSALIAILLLTILLTGLYFINRQRKRNNRLLNIQRDRLLEKNEEIESQRREMEIQKNNLLVANEAITQSKEELEIKSEELKSNIDKLMELDRFKEGLTQMIVHDLKNPLSTILGLSEKPEVLQAGKQMLNMVLNILDVQKLENAQYELNMLDCRLSSIITDALDQIKYLANRKSLKIENTVSHVLFVKADYEMIVRVLNNLLSNAIKYTPNNGKIKIWVEELSTMYQIFVKDSGIGIPKDKHSLIFDKFTQVNPRDLGNVRSTGLGLAFCKMSIEAHGGSIGIDSVPGSGTTFWFTLYKSVNVLPHKTDPGRTDILEEYTFSLSEEERADLEDSLKKLKKLSVYEYSDVKTILAIINPQKSSAIARWKQEMENALKSCNEEKYLSLIQMD